MRRMQVTVFGASGKVGRLVVGALLADGHTVVAFVHSASPFGAHDKLRIIKGDIHTGHGVDEALKGSAAVVSALGSWGTKKKDIVSSGMERIIPAMQANHVKRIISLTGSDARASGDTLSLIHRLSHTFIRYSPERKILGDGERHIRLLEASGLDWTVLRSPLMDERGDPHEFRLGTARPKPWQTVNRHAVAKAMTGLTGNADFSQKAPFITRV